MTPAPGDRLQRFVGDRVSFALSDRQGRGAPEGWTAKLRTNLGRAELLRREIVQAHTGGLALAGASWRDLPMRRQGDGWALELPLAEPGFFKAKAYLIDPRGWQVWPAGPDVGIAVHPDGYRTANGIYCAFARMFGATRTALSTVDAKREAALAGLDQNGFTVIPPSGKLRDLIGFLPHIFETLGCRILHLLPINPTPTTYARFGRFGSPYAALDLTAIDPALVVFDRRTTGIDQFRELAYEVHQRGGRLFLDIVINHTGWGSRLQEDHPEWFLRQPDGQFSSPGAWGNTWEDLVELQHCGVELWDQLAGMFLTWCRRGVDGFRCDAGYKVPMPAWRYIVARVQQEFPQALFLLEGLGGAWEATESLLTDGGMQWAYSELFQNYSAKEVAGYLDHSFRQSERVGLLVHYSETHDNERLAARGRAWSLLRNRLCALASVSGGFGFTAGVEWLATEKIRVHGSTGMAWDNPANIVPELGRLNALLADHPCFFDGARCVRISSFESPIWALRRDSAEGLDTVIVLVNTDLEHTRALTLNRETLAPVSTAVGTNAKPLPDLAEWSDLLGQPRPAVTPDGRGGLALTVPPGGAFCLAPASLPRGLHGDAYRLARAQAAWALKAMNHVLPIEAMGGLGWPVLAAAVDNSPVEFLAAISHLASSFAATGESDPGPTTGPVLDMSLVAELVREPADRAHHEAVFPNVVIWELADARRVTLVPPGYWLLLRDTTPFRAALDYRDGTPQQQVESVRVREGHVAWIAPTNPRPRPQAADADLRLERYTARPREAQAAIRFLAPEPALPDWAAPSSVPMARPADQVLLTNGRGAMARLCVDLGRVNSKYDCVLGANLHPNLPVNRHVLAKRIRVWVSADGFISPLDYQNLAGFEPGPPAAWNFVALAGDGRRVEIRMTADMLAERNTTVFHFERPTASQAAGKQLPPQADVRLTVRVDIEDRDFHSETRRNGGAEHHFATNVHPLGGGGAGQAGFSFTPAQDRQLRVFADQGEYHPAPEWSQNIPHPVEQSRGQTGSGDAYSPGWFDLPLPKGGSATLVVTADPSDPAPADWTITRSPLEPSGVGAVSVAKDAFGQQLLQAASAYLVRRDQGKTVIAGYPWFLDWGRDTFIAARGLIAAGRVEEVKQLAVTFARFEKDGTLPNTIFGADASNRDTSDAPLWFGVVCEEVAAREGTGFYKTQVGKGAATIADTLWSIATHYAKGTPNGIRMDPASALIWSPKHFTWMDTNYPACTPREGYPVEIQALWIRLLRQLENMGARAERQSWDALANRALTSLDQLFWREDRGWYADLLAGPAGKPAAQAVVDDALRSNCLFPISLGLATGARAQRCVQAAARYLVVPGALRSLAPLPVSLLLPNYGGDGRLLNNPAEPYWGRYEGDEDTRRKPAYHNGTAWTWTFPVFCEALARAWEWSPTAVAAARAYLGSMDRLLAEGCLGQIPEILDGDAPHTQRGCDAQAWGVTEAIRVWKLLQP